MGAGAAAPEVRDVANYAVRGASRSIMQSFEELSKSSVVDLDPALIDSSFVSDRIDDADDEFLELLAAIRERGQDSPSWSGRIHRRQGAIRLSLDTEGGRPAFGPARSSGRQEHGR